MLPCIANPLQGANVCLPNVHLLLPERQRYLLSCFPQMPLAQELVEFRIDFETEVLKDQRIVVSWPHHLWPLELHI